MRLFKKAAVCLLAAAMAVSMLTACGDDGPSNPGNGGNGGSTGGGNTSTSTPAKPETPDSKDEDNSVIPEDPEKVTWATSLTKNTFRVSVATISAWSVLSLKILQARNHLPTLPKAKNKSW